MKKQSEPVTVDPPPPAAPPSRGPLWVVLGITAAILIAGGAVFADWWTTLPDDAVATYVGRQKCAQCHQNQVHQWTGSHHDLAMDLATAKTVLGDFNDQTLEHEGMKSRMFQKDGKYFVHTEGPTGQMQDFEVKYTFGVTPLQQYMVELERPKDAKEDEIGRVQVLRISWDTLKKKWFYLPAPDVSEKLQPGDELHWTGITQCWNTTCADCHSTNVHKGFDPQTLAYKTTFSEIDVSCETCHGPGSVHVELASAKSLFWDRKRGYGLPNLKSADSNIEIDTCAKCHSLRQHVLHPDYRGGEKYYDYYSNRHFDRHAYYCDGQILGEVYEYGSFTQSKMYHKNIRCTDCHNPHTLKPKFEGNKLCTSCHQHPVAKYDSPAHHQHKPEGKGGQCVECHMPHRTYMEVDPRRDHSLRVPRPDLSVQLHTPNACTQCHLDLNKFPAGKRAKLKDYAGCLLAAEQGDAEVQAELDRLDRWAAEKTTAWYPKNPAATITEKPVPSSAPTIQAARAGRRDAGEELRKIALDGRYSAMVRASVINELVAYLDDQTVATARKLLVDKSPDVRAMAIGLCEQRLRQIQPTLHELSMRWDTTTSALKQLAARNALTAEQKQQAMQEMKQLGATLERLQDEHKLLTELVAERLTDEVRWPRINAARALLTVSDDSLTAEQIAAKQQALDDYRAGLLTDNDRAMAQVALGYLEEQLNHADAAIERYRLGMRVEPLAVGPRTNLADILERMGKKLIQTGRKADGDVLIAEAKGYRTEELALITRDLNLLPPIAPRVDRVALLDRAGMMATLVGDNKAAEKHLLDALQLDPNSADLLFKAALLYEQKLKDRPKALTYLRRVAELYPQNQVFEQYLRELQQGAPPAFGPQPGFPQPAPRESRPRPLGPLP